MSLIASLASSVTASVSGSVSASVSALPLPRDIPSPPRGVWELGIIPIRAYALCIIIGIIVAGFWGNRRLVARGGRSGAMTDMAVWMIPFGLVGGRLYHLVTDPEIYFYPSAANNYHAQPWKAFAIWDGGLGIWGAIALGALGAYIAARRYKIPFGAIADSLAPGIVLAQAIGRVGNYFNQELFGSSTSLPWALDVYLRTPGGISGTMSQCGSGEFPTEWIKASPTVLCGTYHPTFLYELIWDVLIALLVVWADRRFRLGHGRAFAVYVAGYCVGRGWIEMLRIDHANHILGLRLNVFVASAVFLAAVIYLIATHRLRREDPATVFGIIPGRRGQTAGEPGGGHDDSGGVAADGDGVDGIETDSDDTETDNGGIDTDGVDTGGDGAAGGATGRDGDGDGDADGVAREGGDPVDELDGAAPERDNDPRPDEPDSATQRHVR